MDVTVRDAVEADAAAVARIYIDSWNSGFGGLLGMRAHDAEQVARWAGELTASGPGGPGGSRAYPLPPSPTLYRICVGGFTRHGYRQLRKSPSPPAPE